MKYPVPSWPPTATDHYGYPADTGVLLTIANGAWKLVPTP